VARLTAITMSCNELTRLRVLIGAVPFLDGKTPPDYPHSDSTFPTRAKILAEVPRPDGHLNHPLSHTADRGRNSTTSADSST
jgi:hypothetical protein